MKLDKLDIKIIKWVLSGDLHCLILTFCWSDSPQGYNYWKDQSTGKNPLDRKTLIEWLHKNGETWEEGALKDLNVQEGDVLAWVKAADGYKFYDDRLKGVEDFVVKHSGKVWSESAQDGFTTKCSHTFRVVSRATPKKEEYPTWDEMTPEEKGALLLAHHEEKVIESSYKGGDWGVVESPIWYTDYCFRVKPDTKVVTLWGPSPNGSFTGGPNEGDTHKVTYNLVDGEVDCDSIKMVKLED